MFDYTDEEADLLTTPGVVSSGQEYPTRHDDMVQANAGYGAAQYNAAAYPLAPLGHGSMRGSPDGIGSYSRLYQMPTPSASNSGVLGRMLSGSPLINGFRAVSGLGADAATTTAPGAAAPVAAASGVLVAVVAAGIVLSGFAGYYVGKAVAPSADKQSKYAWWGVAAALLGGPVGLGIESIIALEHR